MPDWTHVFDKKAGEGDEDFRLDAPAFHRNRQVIKDVLADVLSGASGHVVEVGSGTGQHLAEFAQSFPDLTWWPTDYHASHVVSINAWRQHVELANIMPPCQLDAASETWCFSDPIRPPLGTLRAMLCINVFHISPWAVTEGVLRAAANYLATGGQLLVYGPFKRDGFHISESNRKFDESLRCQDPEWGVRDIADIAKCAASYGLCLDDIHDMPSNNFTLVLSKPND